MDAIVKAEVKLTDQEAKDYAALLARHSLKRGKRFLRQDDVFTLIFALLMVVCDFIYYRNADVSQFKVNAIAAFWLLVAVSVFVLPRLGARKRLETQFARDFRKASEFTILFFKEGFSVENKGPKQLLAGRHPYGRYVRAAELEGAFWLHVTNGKEFLIPKACITEGSAEGLARHLRAKLGKRFLQEEGNCNGSHREG